MAEYRKVSILVILAVMICSIAFGADVYTKADNYTLKVDRTTTQSNNLDYDYLIAQKAAIEASYQAQITEINTMIAEANRLGIKSKPKGEME